MLLMTVYTFSFSAEVIAAGLNSFDVTSNIIVRKKCKGQKKVSAESKKPPKTISTDESVLLNYQTINAICVTTTAPYFASLSSELIPYFDVLNSAEISEIYDSPSLLRDPFPPRA